MEKIIWKTEKRKLADLKPFEGNPRKATEKEVKDIDKSLERFNLADPLVINTTNTIIGGHLRYNRLKAKGIKEVDVRVPSRKLTGKEAEELCLRLNKNTGSFDFDLLANFEEDLLKKIGWESEELDKIFGLEQDEKEDEVPELPKKAKSKLGDLYQLGNHRLLCGNATKESDVHLLMDGKKADIVFTDPPYNISYQGIKRKKDIIKNDKLNREEYKKFLLKSFQFIIEPAYICCNWQSYPLFWQALEKLNKKIKAVIVWDKERRAQNLDKYAKRHEFIIYLGNLRGKTIRDDIYRLSREYSTLHPTCKPIELVKDFIADSSKRNNIILDFFGGSGSTLIAAEKLDRRCFMLEIDPLYIDVIIERYKNYAGKGVKKIDA